jgi:transcriptional regulator with XRE-family HTH domain
MSRRKRPADLELEPTYLRAWRLHKKMTMEQVASHMHIDQAALSRIETKKTPYDQYHLQQLSQIYGVSIPDLLYRDPDRPRPADVVAEKVKKLEAFADLRAVETLVDALLSRK